MIDHKEIIAEGFKGERAIVLPFNIRKLLSDHPITSKMHVTDIGYYPSARNHYRDRPEGALEYILIYCYEGGGWIQYEKQKYTMSVNDVFILPRLEAHSYAANQQHPWSIYWIHFNGTDCHLFKTIIGKVIGLQHSVSNKHEERIQIFENIFQTLQMGYSPENLAYSSFCLQYFLASIQYQEQFQKTDILHSENIFQEIILFMWNHIETGLCLEEIASQFNYSKSHLNMLFTQKTSFPPMVYFNQLRLQRACSYLQFTELTIKEIAFRLHFYDPFHFSKNFTKEMKISPKEYRKKYKK